ncbi:MAG: glycosyl hydrolase family 28-related protein [Pseudomonadota bacterium]
MSAAIRTLIEERVGTAKATTGMEMSTILLALLDSSGSAVFPNVAELLATDRTFDVGTFLATQAEAITYQVVASNPNVPQIILPSGTCLLPVEGAAGLDARATGIVADGVTDDTDALQLAIDIAMFSLSSPTRVLLPAGIIFISRTIHLGYGDSGFRTVPLVGHGNSYGRATAFAEDGIIDQEDLIAGTSDGATPLTNHAGTIIYAGHTDAPAINIQGARGALISDLYVRGPLRSHYQNMILDADAISEDAWLPDGLPASADSRYAPYAGIVIDGYAGPRPSVSYPDVNYPAWDDGTQYNRKTSSSVRLINVAVEGFVVGLACQPADVDTNGDFLTVRDCRFFYSKYGLSIGNSQSRNVTIADCEFHRCFIAMTNNLNGRQRGRFGGVIHNVSMSNIINVFRIGSLAFAGPMTVTNLYMESSWRLGSIGENSSNETSVIFLSPRFSLGGLHTDEIGVPATLYDGPGVDCTIRFVGGYVETANMIVMNTDQVVFDEVHTDSIVRRIDGLSPGLAAAHNLAGNVVFGAKGQSARPSTIMAQTFDAAGDRTNTVLRPHLDGTIVENIRVTDAVVTGRTLTHPDIVSGSVIIEPSTMTVFLADADGTAEAQNNYRNGALITPLATSGPLWQRRL